MTCCRVNLYSTELKFFKKIPLASVVLMQFKFWKSDKKWWCYDRKSTAIFFLENPYFKVRSGLYGLVNCTDFLTSCRMTLVIFLIFNKKIGAFFIFLCQPYFRWECCIKNTRKWHFDHVLIACSLESIRPGLVQGWVSLLDNLFRAKLNMICTL